MTLTGTSSRLNLKHHIFLPTNRDHAAVRLVVVSKIVLFGFFGDDAVDEVGEFAVGAAGAENGLEIKLQVAT